MMREIKFRGKCAETGQWVYGSYVDYPVPMINDMEEFIEVVPETIGQFTGRVETNCRGVYEGDIVEVFDTRDDLHFKGEVVFENCSFAIRGRLVTHYRWMDYEVTHIGNVHDNPELLGENA